MKIRWCMVPQTWSAKDRIFVILDHFLPFYPKTTWKIKILKKWKNRDIIILQKCTKNHDHMLHCSWDMACNRCSFYFSFWAIFCPFIDLTILQSNWPRAFWPKCQEPDFSQIWDLCSKRANNINFHYRIQKK